MMPLENTSRWPRLVSHRGRNESSATKLARNGKPLKLVLPPVYRISAVAAWTQVEQHVPETAWPKTSLRLLGEHRRVAGRVRRGVGGVRQPGDAGDQEAEDARHRS